MEQEYDSNLHQERRRTIRIRRSALLKANLDKIDRPSIKIAETQGELEQAYSLVYKEYLEKGYIKPHPSELAYNIYNFLPSTCVYIFKSYLTVISTLTQIEDSREFGLPMDSLYRREVDQLRNRGRKVTELSALATPKELRWCNLMIYLAKTMFEYSRLAKVNDICIMVNPKHVQFYKAILLFEDFGKEKYYPAVEAPAVALRINFNKIDKRLMEVYKDYDFESNLYNFFCKMSNVAERLFVDRIFAKNCSRMDEETFLYFLNKKPKIFDKLTSRQREYFQNLYPTLHFPESRIKL
ncbi:N-acyl amino acid synthase FeeM domain-containing protein [Desulfonatronum parangueonense]